MPSFLKDYSKFNGTGEMNEEGKDLERFLDEYDPKRYETPSVTTDILVFWNEGGWLVDSTEGSTDLDVKLLMIKRRDHPCIGQWALPGGFVNIRENLEDAVKRELYEETGLELVDVEQLHTWGEVWRDPRHRIITTAYVTLLEGAEQPIRAGDDAKEAKWFRITHNLEKEMTLMQGGREKVKRYYKLQLTGWNENEGAQDPPPLSAVLLKTENKDGILKMSSYEVLQSEGIAFDHARFIVQALDHLHIPAQGVANTIGG